MTGINVGFHIAADPNPRKPPAGQLVAAHFFQSAAMIANRHPVPAEPSPRTPESMLQNPRSCCLLLAALCWSWGPVQPSRQARASDESPNIILINLDDADADLLDPQRMATRFPHLNRLATEGIRFTNMHVTTPLCGPSRACLLRGQYAHNTGIRSNDPFSDRSNGFGGGMRLYRDLGYFQNDLSTWMKAAGYRNMLVGKFLHGDTLNLVPAGWDDFYSSRGAEYYGTWRFTNKHRPEGEVLQEDINSYRTRVESDEVIELIRQHVARDDGTPFFVYFNPLTPHNEAPASKLGMVEQKYAGLWPDMPLPQTEDFDESDMQDKSTAIRNLPPLSQNARKYAVERNRLRHVSMKTVDDMVETLLATLSGLGIDDNTYILLTSDNGFCNGHHRLFGKSDPYQRSTNVPLLVWGPGIPAGTTAGHLLAHIDIAPTIVELAGRPAPPPVDGKSFRSLLFNPETTEATDWRDAVLIENWERRYVRGTDYNFGSLALRMFDSVYIEWADGTAEFYDLSADPLQLQNCLDQLPPGRQDELSRSMRLYREIADQPNTTISVPFAPGDILKRNSPLQGMAEDGEGIRNVKLVLRRMSDYACWNGEAWQPEFARIDAALANPGQQLTAWSCELPDDLSGDEYVGVWAQAWDVTGQCDTELPWALFRIDTSGPVSTMEIPAAPVLNRGLSIRGTATDERRVTDVRLVIRNTDSGLYWTGDRWVDNWTYLVLPVARSTQTWSYSHPGIQGHLYISSRAVDDSGNVQSPPTGMNILVTGNEDAQD